MIFVCDACNGVIWTKREQRRVQIYNGLSLGYKWQEYHPQCIEEIEARQAMEAMAEAVLPKEPPTQSARQAGFNYKIRGRVKVV